MEVVTVAATAGGAAAVIMAGVDTISAAGMAAVIFTAGRRISVHSPDIVGFPRNA